MVWPVHLKCYARLCLGYCCGVACADIIPFHDMNSVFFLIPAQIVLHTDFVTFAFGVLC
jgi:hypothetical protein